ncbi:MAG: radical SAM protein, partial [Thermoplasmata archaeon]|nr:radical SAM protein [Thermoplasmata archaeon]
DPNLARVFMPWVLRNPGRMAGFARMARAHRRASEVRLAFRGRGTVVPPFLILSMTSRCNLACAGCYAAAAGTTGDMAGRPDDLSSEEWRGIISEACDAGVFGFVMAGGEPFLHPGLLDLMEGFRDRLFIVVTNGTVISDEHLRRLGRMANAVVLVSVDGDRPITDSRRGPGVHGAANEAIGRLCRSGVLTGISVAVTRDNFRYWMDEGNLDAYLRRRVRIGAFIEYIPTTPPVDGTARDGGDHRLMLTPSERSAFRATIVSYRERKPVYIIHSPGDEEFFGGCVSAGRGFAHVTPWGDLTPCPVSDIATHNLTVTPFIEALASPLFENIRREESLLETEGMPCALFAHPHEVDEIAERVGAYRAGGARER